MLKFSDYANGKTTSNKERKESDKLTFSSYASKQNAGISSVKRYDDDIELTKPNIETKSGTGVNSDNYKTASAYNDAVKTANFDEQFKGYTYDQVQNAMKNYAVDSDEYKYLDRYTNYSSVEDFDKAIAGLSEADYDPFFDRTGSRFLNEKVFGYDYSERDELKGYKSSLEQKKNLYQLDHAFDSYKGLMDEEGFDGSYDDSQTDELYNLVNNGMSGTAMARGVINGSSTKAEAKYREYSLNFLDDEEKAVYNYLYSQDKNKAQQFLDDLKVNLNKRAYDKGTGTIDSVTDSWLGRTVMSTLSVPANVFGGITDAFGAVAEPSNPYSRYYSLTNSAGAIREKSAENIAEDYGSLGFVGESALPFLYQTGMSVLDSMLGASMMGEYYTPIMGMNAYQQRYKELVESGESEDKAQATAVASGVAEAFFEKFSLDKFLKEGGIDSGKAILKNILSQSGVEASEEVATEISNIVTDTMLRGDTSDIAKEVDDLRSKGYTDGEIASIIFKEKGIDVALAGLGGFISGIPMGAFSSTKQYFGNKKTGQNISAKGNTTDMLEMASLSDEESDLYEAYSKYAEAGINADNISDVQLGNLFNTAYRDAVDTADAEQRNKNRVNDDNLIRSEAMIEDLNNIYNTPLHQIQSNSENSVEQNTDNSIHVQNETETKEEAEAVTEAVEETGESMTEQEIEEALNAMSESNTANVETENTETPSISDVESTANNVENETTVQNVEESTKNTAYDYVKESGRLAKGIKNLSSIANILTSAEVQEAYHEGLRVRKKSIQRDNTIRQASQKAGQQLSKKGKFDGSIFDMTNKTTDGSKINWNSLTNRQQEAVKFAQMFCEATGVNITFVQSRVENGKRKGKNGSYNKNTNTIEIDVYAGINDVADNASEAIITTMSHEITHWMETKAPSLYAELRESILTDLRENGKDLDKIIADEIARLDRMHPDVKHTEEDALAEITARACEDMLSNSAYVKNIVANLSVENQKKLSNKIRKMVADLKQWISSLLGQYESNSAEAKFLRNVDTYLTRTSVLWDQAFEEAVSYNKGSSISDIEAGLESISGQKITDGVSKDMNTIVSDKALQMSERTYAEGGRDYLVKWLKNRKGISQAEAEDILLQTDKIAELMKAVREGNDLPDYSNWANMDVVMAEDDKGRSKKVTVIVKNGDYAMNIDFSQVCKKRVALNRVLNQMVKSGMLDNFIMGESDVSLLNSIIKEEGFEIACALCFVDSKRYRVGSWANSFCNGADEKNGNHKYGFNEMVKSLVPKGSNINVDEFNFTGRDIKNNPTTNLLSDMDDSKLDFTLIDSIMKNNDVRSAQHRYARAIKKNASLRKTLNPAEIISSIGYDSIRAESPELFRLINGHQGTAKPKFSHDQVVYKNDILQASSMTAKKAYMVGGVRLQSFSDFMTNMVFDYVQMVSELSAKKLPVHTYTKEAIFVKLFGLTGMKINMSLVPKAIEMTDEQKEHFKPLFDPKPKKGEANYDQRIAEYNAHEAEYESLAVNAGLDNEGNYIWEDETFPYDVAIDIVKDSKYSKNCGTIAVGISKNHIIKLLSDDTIHMVIPYHKSGLNHEVALMRNIALYHDYTSVQNTRYTKADGTIGKLEKGMKDFNFYEDLYKTNDPKQTASNYLAFCNEHGYTPKFDEFAYHENYYKLLADFRLYDNDGTYAPQQAVKPIYPDIDTMKDLIVNGYTFNGVTYGGLKQQEKASEDLRKKNDKIIDRWTSEMNAKAGRDLFEQNSDREIVDEKYISDTADMIANLYASFDTYDYMDMSADADMSDSVFLKLKDGDYSIIDDIKYEYYDDFDDEEKKTADDIFRRVEMIASVNPNSKDYQYSDRDTAEFNGKEFWSGAVNLSDGVIEEVHSIKEAKNADYHHTLYFSDNAVDKIDDGEYGFFWVDNRGNVVGEWRDDIPKGILNKIKSQITIIPNDGIQYSDRDYMSLAQDPEKNRDMLQEMVNKKASENGYNLLVYHGTRNGGNFTIFNTNEIDNNIGSHFGSEEIANIFKSEGGENAKVFKVFIKSHNPYETYDWFGQDDYYPAWEAVQLADQIGTKEALEIKERILSLDEEFRESYEMDDVNEGYFDEEAQYILYRDFRRLLELGGFDSIKYENSLELEGDINYIIQHPEQIKSAEPVTYDNNGNIIPLSERFSDSTDIRFADRVKTEADTALEVERQKEIDALIAETENLKEKLELEKQLTGGNKLNRNQIQKVARSIKSLANSKYDTAKLTKELESIYNYINNTVDVDATSVFGKLTELAKAVAGEERETIIRDDYLEDITKAIINRKIKLTPEIESWLTNQYGKNFRSALRGLVYFGTNEGVSLDERWNYLAEMYPDTFDENITGEDQLSSLIDIAQATKEGARQIQTFNTAETIKDIAYAMYDGYWDVSPIKTTADKYQAKIDKLNREHSNNQTKLKERISDLKESLNKNKLADDMYYGKIINRLRKQKTEAYKTGVEKTQKKYEKQNETREKNRIIASITKNSLDLNKKLTDNSVKSHIPESMKGAVIGLLNTIDYSSKQLLGKYVPTGKDLKMSKALEKVRRLFSQMEADQKDSIFSVDLPIGYVKKVEELVDALEKLEENSGVPYVLNEMTIDQLNDLDNIVKIIKSSVNNLNRWSSSISGDLIHDCEQSIEEVDKNKQYTEKSGILKSIKTTLVWNNTNPIFAFERFGSVGMKVFSAIQDGWDTFAYHVNDIKQYAEDTFSGKECKDWENDVHTFELSSGTVKMNSAQLMSLYCLIKREHAKEHLLTGGIRVNDFKNGKKVVNQPTAYRLSETEIRRMFSELTPRQIEVATKLQSFMNSTCSDWGNEITMARYGFKAFIENNYFPIKVNQNQVGTGDPNDRENSLFRLLNLSFTNPLTKGANGSIEIDSIFDVFATHSTDMAKYNALALPVLDAYKWYSYKARTEIANDEHTQIEERSVRESIERAFGKDGNSYIVQFLKDINGQHSVARDLIGNTWLSKGKMASVGLNARVVALQPTSYFRALLVLDADDMSWAFTQKNNYKKAEENCGMAMWKSLGFYDVNVGRGLSEMIKRNQTTFDKLTEASMAGAGKADEITIGYLWNACQHNVKKHNKNLTGKALDRATALKLRDVIYHTQVVDSTMTRSQMMRSKDGWDKIKTNFMSEPTLSYNILANAVYEYSMEVGRSGKAEAFKKNGKKIARAITAYTITNMVAGLVEALFDALRSKKEYLDEEDLLDMFLSNFKEDMSIIGKIPVLKDIKSIFNGYSQSSLEMQSVSSMYDAWKQIDKAFNGKEWSPYKMANAVLKSFSYASGLPLSNGERDLKAIFNRTGLMTYDDMEDLFNEIIGSVFPFLDL